MKTLVFFVLKAAFPLVLFFGTFVYLVATGRIMPDEIEVLNPDIFFIFTFFGFVLSTTFNVIADFIYKEKAV